MEYPDLHFRFVTALDDQSCIIHLKTEDFAVATRNCTSFRVVDMTIFSVNCSFFTTVFSTIGLRGKVFFCYQNPTHLILSLSETKTLNLL